MWRRFWPYRICHPGWPFPVDMSRYPVWFIWSTSLLPPFDEWRAGFRKLEGAILLPGRYTFWGTTWTEYMRRPRPVLQRIQEVGMLLSPKKCRFGVRCIEFLGHVIGKGMLSISEARRQALINTPKPTTVTMLTKALVHFSTFKNKSQAWWILQNKGGKKML